MHLIIPCSIPKDFRISHNSRGKKGGGCWEEGFPLNIEYLNNTGSLLYSLVMFSMGRMSLAFLQVNLFLNIPVYLPLRQEDDTNVYRSLPFNESRPVVQPPFQHLKGGLVIFGELTLMTIFSHPVVFFFVSNLSFLSGLGISQL